MSSAAGGPSTAPDVVGRGAELAELGAFLAPSGGVADALVLSGEAGMGKTTLWHAAVALARERGDHVLVAQPTEPERQLSFSALADLLRDVPPPVRTAGRSRPTWSAWSTLSPWSAARPPRR